MDIISGLTSVFSGGLTGLIGAGLTAFIDMKKQAAQFDHDFRMEELSLKAMSQEYAARKDIAMVEGQTEISIADAAVLKESYAADRLAYSPVTVWSDRGWYGWVLDTLLVLVDVLRGSVRPLVTYFLVGFMAVLFMRAYGAYGGINPSMQDPAVLGDIVDQIIATALYVTTTCVLWWFGTRSAQKGK